MNVWFYIIVMAVIQGIAEFLPISSSGHLALLGALFGFDGEKSQALGIVLHAGSLLAIVIFYWKTLLGFLKPEQWRLAAMLILGTIPAGVLGMALELSGFAKDLFDNLMVIGFAFLITATLLRLSEKPKLIIRPSGRKTRSRRRSTKSPSARRSRSVSDRCSRFCPACPAPAPPSPSAF